MGPAETRLGQKKGASGKACAYFISTSSLADSGGNYDMVFGFIFFDESGA
jgi:hypothetical protein